MNMKDQRLIIVAVIGAAAVSLFLTIFFFTDVYYNKCEKVYGVNANCINQQAPLDNAQLQYNQLMGGK